MTLSKLIPCCLILMTALLQLNAQQTPSNNLFRSYLDSAKKLNDTNSDSAIIYLKRAETLSSEISDSNLLLRLYFQYSFFLYTAKPDLDMALKYNDRAISFINSKTTADSIARIYMTRARTFLGKQDFNKTFEALNKSEEATLRNSSDYLLWDINFARAETYTFLDNGPKAVEYYEKSLETLREKNIRMDYGFVLYNAIESTRTLNMDQAYANFLEEFMVFSQARKKKTDNVPDHLFGFFEDEGGELATINKINKFLPFHENSNNTNALGVSYMKLGTFSMRQNNYAQAIKYFSKGLPAAKLHLLYNYIGYVENLATCHEKLGHYKDALKYSQQLLMLRDSMKNLKVMEQVNQLSVEYETEKKEQAIDLLAAQNEIQDVQLKQQEKTILFSTLALFIFAILSFFIYRLYSKVNIQNSIISKALEEKDILLREIHHRVKNNLQIISSLLSLQSRQIDDKDIQQAINEGKNRVRSVALIHQNLYQKENLTGVGVINYLETLTSELFETYNISKEKIKLILKIDEIDLDVDTMVPLGLIINELVSNALKHAFPNEREGNITITLQENNEQLYFAVEDDGVGLDLDSLSKTTSFGNRLVNAFSKKLKADLNISGDNGTKVSMLISNYKKAA